MKCLFIGILIGVILTLWGTGYFLNYQYCNSLSLQQKYPVSTLHVPQKMEELIYSGRTLTTEESALLNEQRTFTYNKCMIELKK